MMSIRNIGPLMVLIGPALTVLSILFCYLPHSLRLGSPLSRLRRLSVQTGV